MDRLPGSYRPMIQAKMWWWSLMTNLLSTSIVAAWKFYCTLYEKDGKKISHLDLRSDIVLVLMKSSSSRRQTQRSRHADLPTEIRYDGQNHKPVPCTHGKCIVCSKNTRSKCGKCNIRLHYTRGSNCFIYFHKK